MANKKGEYLKNWTDHPDNPLIEPPWPEFLLGDPTCVTPEESPDGSWHLFANTLRGIHHYRGDDGIRWRRLGRIFPGFRAFVFKEGDLFHLFTEDFTVPQFRSRVVVRSSIDLENWGKPQSILAPSYPWEGNLVRTCGNPCVVKADDDYLLYYSANVVFLPDLGFCEPLYVGVARAEKITGPYLKSPEPLISPDAGDDYRNLGAGAIKVVRDEERGLFYGFNNGIYKDLNRHTRSAVLLMSSRDGIEWDQVYPEPVVAPGGSGWKKALVYQLDVKRVGDEWWMYYNARSGWRFGKERIGLATCPAT